MLLIKAVRNRGSEGSRPTHRVNRIDSPAYAKKVARQNAFLTWGKEWSEARTKELADPLSQPKAYEYVLIYPPDFSNHPLFATAKSKPHEDIHITRAAHCTAMQVAVYHSFSHDYASRHRKDPPPEDSICPCGLPYTTYHVVYECPRYAGFRRQFRLDRMGEHDLSVILGCAPMTYYNNHSDRIHGEYSTPRRAAQSFLMFLQTSKAFSRPVPELPDPSPLIFDPG